MAPIAESFSSSLDVLSKIIQRAEKEVGTNPAASRVSITLEANGDPGEECKRCLEIQNKMFCIVEYNSDGAQLGSRPISCVPVSERLEAAKLIAKFVDAVVTEQKKIPDEVDMIVGDIEQSLTQLHRR